MTIDAEEVSRTYGELTRAVKPVIEVSLSPAQCSVLELTLQAPTINILLRGFSLQVSAEEQPLHIQQPGTLRMSPSALAHPALAVFHLRQGVEQLAWTQAAHTSSQAVSAALLALHSSLLFLESMPSEDQDQVLAADPSWLGEAFRSLASLRAQQSSPQAIIAGLAPFLRFIHAFNDLLPSVGEEDEIAIRRVAECLALAQPTERLLTLGGDERLLVHPGSGLNKYGCSPSPRPWAITFSTCTASSISEAGFAYAEAQRRCLFPLALAGQLVSGFAEEMERIRRHLAQVLLLEQVPGAKILLTPSGTDAELFAVHCASAVAKRPLLNILIAPREIGSGSRYAAAGCHFDHISPLGGAVQPGTAVEGLHCDQIQVQELELRDETGQPLSSGEVEDRLHKWVSSGIKAGSSALIHLLDSSKTGLGAPSLECIAKLQAVYGERVAVIVDAAQMRVSRANLASYLRRGFYVIATGSKFFTGPPFAGALLIPPSVASSIDVDSPFPQGLSGYVSRWEVPEEWRWPQQVLHLGTSPNYGLLLRWQAALWEMEAFFAANSRSRYSIFRDFAEMLRDRMEGRSFIEPLPPSVYCRANGEERESWDSVPTIFTFLIRRASALLTYDEAVIAYHWLNADLSGWLPAGSSEAERRLAAQCCHIGQPVRIRYEEGDWLGALRIAPGSRLVSRVCFDPSIGENQAQRLAQQVDAACIVLDKLEIICRYWQEFLQASAHLPRP
ncbi:hypothetical protein [Nitrosococcus watsonii]|uniref:Uncharacterized protein n=1 Tax=Nitrosococcus watsoni (strain C-113) TaxID=105559 RepID=D8K6T1_NITWC|nr:hypothetical protein [Nitrosococcus watsonii]ADJ28608.1 conserved hypothetical protein [Nitrosococcus watsonii C-113]